MDIEGQLRAAVEDAVMGEPLDARLAGRARTAALTVLHRAGRKGRVDVRPARGGVEVRVILDPGTPRVREVRFSLG